MEIPSFLMGPGNFTAGDGSWLNNTRLRVGEVQEIVPPKDPRNRSKKFYEYRVFVQHRENGTATTKMYESCLLMNAFAGLADQLHYTLRAEKSAEKKGTEPGLGSKVLILCINGETHSGVIIGGLRDATNDKDETDKGHHLSFSFNGVEIEINKDGELSLQVRGATDAKGKAKNDKQPSSLKIAKDGKITAQTKEGKNKIVIEHGKVTVTAESSVEVNCKTAKVTATKTSIISTIIELGAEGIGGVPAMGMVHGSWIEPLTGRPVYELAGASTCIYGKK